MPGEQWRDSLFKIISQILKKSNYLILEDISSIRTYQLKMNGYSLDSDETNHLLLELKASNYFALKKALQVYIVIFVQYFPGMISQKAHSSNEFERSF